jgi:hypothetical protein
MNNHSEYNKFKDFISSLSPEQIKEGKEKEHKITVKQYEQFLDAYTQNKCFICDLSFDDFNINKPCLHWLLNPKGFKKRHFSELYPKYGFTNIQSFLRWIANQENKFGNINDLVEEKDPDKLIDNTIKYRNLEWSFSCAKSDLNGHRDKLLGKEPHYHFQMRINKKPFINFRDFHIPLTKYDIIAIEMINDKSDKFQHKFPFGEGMQDALNNISPENIINYSTPTLDEEKAIYKFDTIVEAIPGQTINGDEIYKLIQESKEKQVSVSSLLPKLDAKVTTIVSPGPAVPEIAHRKKRKRG